MGEFRAFGPAHLAILASVPAVAGALAACARAAPRLASPLRMALAGFIAVNAVAAHANALARGWLSPPHGLPLELCDAATFLAIAALVAPRPWMLDLLYYVALAGTSMALLTPDLGAPFPSLAAITYFVGHGAVVAAVLMLVWLGGLRPRPGSWWRALLALNAYAAAVGLFNQLFGTNYMFLCRKPASASLLDVMGPWPWYILGGEVVALALFLLLYLPFRRVRR
jgi:hypothetical integral membrane protein (TIGR02206 family)